jgi:hypothetical protein
MGQIQKGMRTHQGGQMSNVMCTHRVASPNRFQRDLFRLEASATAWASLDEASVSLHASVWYNVADVGQLHRPKQMALFLWRGTHACRSQTGSNFFAHAHDYDSPSQTRRHMRVHCSTPHAASCIARVCQAKAGKIQAQVILHTPLHL